MQVLRVRGDAPDARLVALAASLLERGEMIIYPTDTLYALGCRAVDAAAVDRLRAAKARDTEKPLPVVAADVAQARSLWARWPAQAAVLADRFWPGPLTLVLEAAPGLPRGLTAASGSLAVRVPALALVRALCAAAGPLVSTSANLAGGPPATTCEEALAGLPGAVALALDAGPANRTPSTLVDVTGTEPRLIREGAVPWATVCAFLNRVGP
jgi:L-threonylcarbamoyladenylate synthase